MLLDVTAVTCWQCHSIKDDNMFDDNSVLCSVAAEASRVRP